METTRSWADGDHIPSARQLSIDHGLQPGSHELPKLPLVIQTLGHLSTSSNFIDLTQSPDSSSHIGLTGSPVSSRVIDLTHPPDFSHVIDLTIETKVEDETIALTTVQQLSPGNGNDSRYMALDAYCIGLAWDFIERWEIPVLALVNFLELASGNPSLPVIMLLNPTNDSEKLPFHDMIQKSRTLGWVSGVLGALGLGLSDVVVLDVCPLLSESRLSIIGDLKRAEALDQAYNLTEAVLKSLNPRTIISCQCKTNDRKWNPSSNALAIGLCSSLEKAKTYRPEVMSIDENAIQVVQGFHPMFFLYADDDDYKYWGAILENMFRMAFSSCSSENGEPLSLVDCNGQMVVVELLDASGQVAKLDDPGSRLLAMMAAYKDSIVDVRQWRAEQRRATGRCPRVIATQG